MDTFALFDRDGRTWDRSSGDVPHYDSNRDTDRLTKIVLVYEDSDRWEAAILREGLKKRAAHEASQWLLRPHLVHRLALSLQAAAHNVEVEVVSIEALLDNIDGFVHAARAGGAILWNITDGSARFKGSHVTNLATLAGVPYFGCPPFTQALGQDKYKLYLLCQSLGIRVPRSMLIEGESVLHSFMDATAHAPFFVKPNSLGNKVGVSPASLQTSPGDAVKHASKLGRRFRDRVVVQEFVDGPEVRVTFLNADPESKRKMGYQVIRADAPKRSFITQGRRERDYDSFADWLLWPRMEPAQRHAIRLEIDRAIETLSRHVTLKDYFSFDFRIGAGGEPYLIDFNPGAFLYGNDVEAYTQTAFGLSLPQAITSALQSRYASQRRQVVDNDVLFRL